MKRIVILAVMMVMATAMQAEAGLETIGTATYGGTNYNLIYDNDDHLTWLDYTNGFDIWDSQVGWASGLNTGGVLTYNFNPGVTMTWSDEWRLPTTVNGPYVWGSDGTTTAGYNITSSEMGHLYYTEFGNKGYYATDGTVPQPGWGLNNAGDFQNLQSGWYWSGTEYSASTYDAWGFDISNGNQHRNFIGGNMQGIAVRPGQLAVVPEPMSMVLFGIGGTILGFRRFRKTIKSEEQCRGDPLGRPFS